MAQPPSGVHVTYQTQFRRCGNPRCKCKQPNAPGHGPYRYAYWREKQPNGKVKLRSAYIGKEANLPPYYNPNTQKTESRNTK